MRSHELRNRLTIKAAKTKTSTAGNDSRAPKFLRKKKNRKDYVYKDNHKRSKSHGVLIPRARFVIMAVLSLVLNLAISNLSAAV